MLFQTGPRALLGPTAQVPGGSEPPGTASSDASELDSAGGYPPIFESQVPGGSEPSGTWDSKMGG